MKNTSLSHRKAGMVPALLFFGLVALVLCALSPTLRADETGQSGQPARAVRLSYVDGKVQLAQGGQVISDQAVANTPLLQGMTLTTADDGRAEIQFEDGSVARLSPDTSLTLKVLAGSGTAADAELELDKGLGYFELQANGQMGQMRVRFGDAVATASGFTVLRVRNDTPPGDLAVFSGNAHVERGSGTALDLNSGESVTFTASDPNNYIVAESIEPDSWDSWNSDRDQALSAEASSQTSAPESAAGANPANPAWNDLDSSGTWYNVPDQGYVWSPYEASNPDFDPYGNGNWVAEPGFGYVWASGYPWGYMPYQCGAWNYYGGFGWGWAPGFGGCNPWWNIGFYGGPVFGFVPGWYHPIRRPHFGGPHGPIHGRPFPVIAVNHNSSMHGPSLPTRDRNNTVNIGGHVLQGLRPAPSRVNDERAVFANHPTGNGFAPGQSSGGNRPVFTTPRPGYTPRQGFNGDQQPGRQPGYVTTQPGRTFTPPPANPGMANPGMRPAAPPPTRNNYYQAPAPNPQPTHTYTPPSPPAHNSGGSGSFHPSGGGGGGGGGGSFHGGGSSGGGGGGGHSSGGSSGGGGHR